jgi:hypothetical protein
MSEQKETPIQQIRRVCAEEGHFQLETSFKVEDLNPGTESATANEREALILPATPEETKAITQKSTEDFISTYIKYADVLEAPPEAHEAVATQLLASILNPRVHIQHGAIKVPLDLWLLLLSNSGFGRNTLVDLSRPILGAADLGSLILNTTWGSKQAFYQNLSEQPTGLLVWPELSVVLKKLGDDRFAGAKEWLTDRYDNFNIPEAIRYRETGKKSDTPSIVFGQAPRLNILATSSFDWFFSNLAYEDAAGGFIPRWILKKLGKGKLVPKPPAPDETLLPLLVERLQTASKLKGVADLSAGEKQYEWWYRRAHGGFSEQPNSGLAMPFFNRLRTHVLKLAVVYEVSQSNSLTVTPKAMSRAIKAAHAAEETIFALLSTGMSREGSEVERMSECIRQAGPDGLLRSQLTHVFQHVRSNDREARLRTLIDAGSVRPFSRPSQGRRAEVLVHKDHVDEHKRLRPADLEHP